MPEPELACFTPPEAAAILAGHTIERVGFTTGGMHLSLDGGVTLVLIGQFTVGLYFRPGERH